jgi:hypothetical protein
MVSGPTSNFVSTVMLTKMDAGGKGRENIIIHTGFGRQFGMQ